jgi:hypothetical protein
VEVIVADLKYILALVLCRDLKTGPSEYEEGKLTATSRCSLR